MSNHIALESLPDGTVIKTTILYGPMPVTHYGTVRREWSGRVVIDHNSKRLGYAAATDFDGFHDGVHPVFVHRYPANFEEGWEIAARTRADVERGIRWTVDNNCEDMISRALTGRDGSPTRNFVLGVGLVAILVALIVQ